MQSIKQPISVIVFLGLLLLTSNFAICQNYSSRITIAGNSIDKKTYSDSEIRSILKGKINNWKNGNRVLIVLILNEDEKSEYLARAIYNKSVNGVKKYWLGLVFQGRADAPIFADDNEEVLRLLKKNKGAIGVLVDYKKTPPPELTVKISKSR
jgi:ABC-type phosphate transport system substrate-binding protein